ncbi:MAG: flavin reductase family protein [Fuerstiella sp.]|nr:flavin reductase family protein [Fuerstiella sp.]
MDSSVPKALKEKLTPILGRIPSGVFILVAGNEAGRQTGMLASWVQQASFEPPQVTVAVNKSRYLNEWLIPGSPITLNQVRKNDPSLFRHFGKGFEPDDDAFDGVESEDSDCGLPLLPDAMVTLEGQVVSQMEAGDHVIYLATITSGTAHEDPAEFNPFVHIRKNGFSY